MDFLPIFDFNPLLSVQVPFLPVCQVEGLPNLGPLQEQLPFLVNHLVAETTKSAAKPDLAFKERTCAEPGLGPLLAWVPICPLQSCKRAPWKRGILTVNVSRWQVYC